MNITGIITLIAIPTVALLALSKIARIIARSFVSLSVRVKYKEAIEFWRQQQNTNIND